ncbi:MAG: 4Fe-4S dicluster domain-containing protein, partial [Rikenellaceae bacterium]|nr:4Fe-4S dicluster domain-containing protein [Rikenellaceae bacterium]
MPDYYSMLMQDVRFREGLSSCMNCGVCTAVCPAAEFYDYDPRRIVITVFEADNDKIENLLKSETIWYCGECMSCRPRCPRGNTPGYVIQALRTLSQKTGPFIHSEKGRQQLALKRTIGQNILDTGYCMTPKRIDPELHPEQGPVWQWVYDHDSEVFERLGKNYRRRGDGTVREIDQQVLDEIHKIFDITGGTEMFETIERYSEDAARMMG